MNFQRIWKAIAAVIVVVIAVAFVIRVRDWTKGLGSEFVVYGQSGGAAPGGFVVTRIVPQIAVGSFDGNLTKYTTIIQIVNTSSNPVNVQGSFFNSGTGTASDLTYSTNMPSLVMPPGVLPATSIAPGGSLVITGKLPTTNPPVYKGNWARIQATGSITVAAFFEIRDGATNALYSRVGTQASSIMSKFVVPRARNVPAGLDVAFAIANVGTASVNITGTLKDETGAVVATKVLNLSPGAQSAQFIGQFFGLTDLGTTTMYQSVTFDGGPSAQLGAMAISYEGITQTSFPVDQIQ
jgi:hypothetical protein